MKTPLTYNGKDLKQYLTLEGVSRPLMAPTVNAWSLRPISGAPAKHIRTTRDPYTVSVRYKVMGRTYEEMRIRASALAVALVVDRPAPLITDNSGRYELAILDGSHDLTMFPRHAVGGELNFLVPDGMSHSLETRTGTGLSILNEGNAESHVIIRATITTATTSFSVSLGNLILTIKRQLGIGNIITIDTEREYVTYKQNASAVETSAMANLTLDSDFFVLKPGPNVISAPGSTVQWEYTPTWR